MSKTLATDVNVRIHANYVDSDDLNDQRGNLSAMFEDALATGTGADCANVLWYDSRTVAGAAEEIDLAGALEDVFNDTVTFAEIKGIYIRNKSTTTGETLTIGGSTFNAFASWVANSTDKVIIGPGGVLLLWNPADGYTVEAGGGGSGSGSGSASGDAGDYLKIDPGSATIEYDIILIGDAA